MSDMQDGFEEFIQAFTGLDSVDDLDPESKHIFEATYYAGASQSLFLAYRDSDFRGAFSSLREGDNGPMEKLMAVVLHRGQGLNGEIQEMSRHIADAIGMEAHLH